MNIDQLKPMGFRNSGKFDLSGRGGKSVIIVGVALIVILSALVVGGQMCGSRGKPLGGPDQFFVKCTACGKEWEVERKELAQYQDRDLRDEQGYQIGGNCPHCKEEGCAFVMFQCPNPDCGKYYLLKRYSDPEGFRAGETKDVCPHCDTDLKEWYKARQARRKKQ